MDRFAHAADALALGFCLLLSCAAARTRAAELPGPELRERFGLPVGVIAIPRPVSPVTARGGEPRIEDLSMAHIGGNRVLVALRFREDIPPLDALSLLLYLDVDNDPATGRDDESHTGVDLMLVLKGGNFTVHRRSHLLNAENANARVGSERRTLFLALDLPLPDGEVISMRAYLVFRVGIGYPDSSPWSRVIELPRNDAPVQDFPPGHAMLRPMAEFRYVDKDGPAEFHRQKVALERHANKGLAYEHMAPDEPIAFGRERPQVILESQGRRPEQRGTAALKDVPVLVKEDAGVARSRSAVTFGFPFPEGEVFDPQRVELLDAEGNRVAAQYAVTAFWPDNSLKWILVDFTCDLNPGEERAYTVRFGNRVLREAEPLAATIAMRQAITAAGETLFINTGPLDAEISRDRFNILTHVWYDESGTFDQARPTASWGKHGVYLEDEHGRTFGTSALRPQSFVVEVSGPQRAVVRVEGAYAGEDGTAFMRYVTRLTFRAGSPLVLIEHSHINDCLNTEFADFAKLSMRVMPGQGIAGVSAGWGEPHGESLVVTGEELSLFQWSDKSSTLVVDGRSHEGGRAPGVLRVEGSNGAIGVAVTDFWQRWPKGFRARGEAFTLDLLPPQPGPEYGTDLPPHLMYPLVEGYYRMKWGMSFTERTLFDFSGTLTQDQLAADGSKPLVAVLPGAWYAKTEALGILPAPRGNEFAAWDRLFSELFEGYLAQKDHQREYGFMNYGDFFGERGRNWGNNEYDTAHALFMQFARTGHRDYFRAALAVARHVADVDTVHAWPDPFHIGAQHAHSIAHTGTIELHGEYGTWSHAGSPHAAMGHNWTEGLVESWLLAGESRVMEGALLHGEHIVWAMAPKYRLNPRAARFGGWSIRAVMAVYRATGDPLYLEAAGTIARELASGMDEAGLWKSAYRGGVHGVSNFMQGVGLAGLQQYHMATKNAEVADALRRGTDFLARGWPGVGGWPYALTETAGVHPYAFRQFSGMNLLNAEALAYWGVETGNERLVQVAREAALGCVHFFRPPMTTKEITFTLRSGPAVLGWLQRWSDRQGADGQPFLAGGAEELSAYLKGAAEAARYNLRGPRIRRFRVQVSGSNAMLRLERVPTSSVTGQNGTIRLIDEAGKTVHEQDVAMANHIQSFSVALGAHRAGERFRLEIDDSRMGIWDASGEMVKVLAEASSWAHLSNPDMRRLHFFVPRDCSEFQVHVQGVHPGGYGAAILDPDGELVELYRDINPGGALIASGDLATEHEGKGGSAQGTVTVQPDPGKRGQHWSAVFWAFDNLRVRVEGIPPFLTRSREEWFLPEH